MRYRGMYTLVYSAPGNNLSVLANFRKRFVTIVDESSTVP